MAKLAAAISTLYSLLVPVKWTQYYYLSPIENDKWCRING
jgi:hypothetical protein